MMMLSAVLAVIMLVLAIVLIMVLTRQEAEDEPVQPAPAAKQPAQPPRRRSICRPLRANPNNLLLRPLRQTSPNETSRRAFVLARKANAMQSSLRQCGRQSSWLLPLSSASASLAAAEDRSVSLGEGKLQLTAPEKWERKKPPE